MSETFVQAQTNKLLLIKLRALGGAGLRYRLLKSKDGEQRIYYGLAYLFEHNEFLQEAREANWHRISTYISFIFRPGGGVKLTNTTYFQPEFSDFGNHRMSTEWRLDTPIGKKLTFFTDFTFTIDRSLPEDAPTETYRWLNGLTFKF